MSHTLALEVPDDIYERLARYATQQGQPIDTVAQTLLSQEVTRLGTTDVLNEATPTEEEMNASPFLRMLGSISIGEPGWADKHDAVFGG
ncbi:MAG TPA: hypothetical protein VKQ36_07595, partial [Ktedonobacterales bacterium]|nr:hypothetical protein [Ktedonobacterales bacterium]